MLCHVSRPNIVLAFSELAQFSTSKILFMSSSPSCMGLSLKSIISKPTEGPLPAETSSLVSTNTSSISHRMSSKFDLVLRPRGFLYPRRSGMSEKSVKSSAIGVLPAPAAWTQVRGPPSAASPATRCAGEASWEASWDASWEAGAPLAKALKSWASKGVVRSHVNARNPDDGCAGSDEQAEELSGPRNACNPGQEAILVCGNGRSFSDANLLRSGIGTEANLLAPGRPPSDNT
mmetsp:Transcript_129396/g.414751  ORF Transcript_129396/g.414751 Transcript_129396/m.414751 type:complete len:233 (+) Transcript_129396:243-941(+)